MSFVCHKLRNTEKTCRIFISLITLVIVFALVNSSCKPYYIANDFAFKTSKHESVAILPFQMIYTGKKPEKISDEELKRIEAAESRAFQIAYYNRVLQSTRRGKKPIHVGIQHYDKTLSLLDRNGISIQESWTSDPQELANRLGVEAVITGRIAKHRLMSDLASYGIDLGIHIVNVLSEHRFWPWIPSGATTSKEIKVTSSLVNAADGNTLWSVSYDIDADWSRRTDEIIDNIIKKSAKRFPYRE